jgi:hypothetical protein
MGVAPNLWLNTIRTGVHPPQEVSQQQTPPAAQTSAIQSDRTLAQNGMNLKREGSEDPASLKGHDFSRAVNGARNETALAAEGRFSQSVNTRVTPSGPSATSTLAEVQR